MYAHISKIFIVTISLLVIFPFSALGAEKGDGMLNELFDQESPSNQKTEANESTVSREGEERIEAFESPTITAWDFIKMFLTLGFVLLLLYFTLNFINKRNQWIGASKTVLNVGGTTLGNNKSVQLVKVGDSIFVLGVGDSINLLKEITNEEEKEVILNSYKDRTEGNLALNKVPIKQVWSKVTGTEEKGAPSISFSSLLKKQLGDISQERKKRMETIDRKVHDDE
ncbi:flagellar biosynthetic protein FliO [Sutcliffiella sp. NC1]|uniref:flagellar biosynthetic protein FliO n=1 Tax=Sutcliffiella sp. NC1 TaxID=3004096 RepID=UPI0022DE7E6B|nr:flagellar biosynthetic protein FliO [Sutcliffiella sp. NC1]WBL13282.1 flagellar biosynthetic protein FliO [Sutcliffiella sp. NC1]